MIHGDILNWGLSLFGWKLLTIWLRKKRNQTLKWPCTSLSGYSWQVESSPSEPPYFAKLNGLLSKFSVRQRAQLSVSGFQISSPFRASLLYFFGDIITEVLKLFPMRFGISSLNAVTAGKPDQLHSSPPALTTFISSRAIIWVLNPQHRDKCRYRLLACKPKSGYRRLSNNQKKETSPFSPLRRCSSIISSSLSDGLRPGMLSRGQER